jgi:hypothetical protein
VILTLEAAVDPCDLKTAPLAKHAQHVFALTGHLNGILSGVETPPG